MFLLPSGPVTGTLSCDEWSPRGEPFTTGELLALLSLPFWPALRLVGRGADRILRRAYYRREREERLLLEAHVAHLRELSVAPVFDRDAYWNAVQAFSAARDHMREEREKEDLICLNAQLAREARSRPFASKRALAERAARRRRREPAWRAWTRALAEWAVRRRGAPPSPPLSRPGRTLRKLCERSLRAAPTAEALLAQYAAAKGRGRVEEKIRLGSMLLDLEATVDNGPVRDAAGVIVGRKPGLLGWLRENCRELVPHYFALQQCRRLAHAFRIRFGTADPVPAALLLDASPKEEARLPSPVAAMLPAARTAAERWLRKWGQRPAIAAAAGLQAVRPPGGFPQRVRLRKTE